MDALARLHPTAADLLARVDDALARLGAPAGHPVWPLLRAHGALPGDAVEALVGWEPGGWTESVDLLAAQRDRYESARADLGAAKPWGGPSGEVMAARLRQVMTRLDAAAERNLATAGWLDELSQWLADGRLRAARALARVMTSSDAVVLCTAGAAPATAVASAAAAIGAVVLGELEDVRLDGERLRQRWAARLDEAAGPLPAGPPIPESTATVVHVEL